MAKNQDMTPLQAAEWRTKMIEETDPWATAAARMHLEQLLPKSLKDKNPLEYQHTLNFIANLLVNNDRLEDQKAM